MTKIIIIAVVIAVLCRGIGWLLPRSPTGRAFNKAYHVIGSAIKSVSGGAVTLGRWLGSKKRGAK